MSAPTCLPAPVLRQPSHACVHPGFFPLSLASKYHGTQISPITAALPPAPTMRLESMRTPNSVMGGSSRGASVNLTPPSGGTVSSCASPSGNETLKWGASSRLAEAAPGRTLLNRPEGWSTQAQLAIRCEKEKGEQSKCGSGMPAAAVPTLFPSQRRQRRRAYVSQNLRPATKYQPNNISS